VEDGTRIVTIAERHPETWAELVEQQGHGTVDGERLTREEEADEFLMMGLRLVEGIDLARFETLSGRTLPRRQLSILQEEGLVAPVGNSGLRATPSGMIVLNSLVTELAR
jgi:oxygen-independent coproporphyrinogen-3 oxidase